MKNKNYNTVEDLLSDESFSHWVEGGDDGFWDNWIKHNLDKKHLVDEAIAVLKGTSFKFQEQPIGAEIINQEWEKLQQRVSTEKQIATSNSSRVLKPTFSARYRKLKIAASIAVIAVLGFLVQQYVINGKVIHQTSFGEQLSIILPDSTSLQLNANSKLTYRKQNPRKVWLDGEAYFEVKKKPTTGANFLVLTNDLTIEVLGTAFNVVEKEDKTEVILEEGSIKLNLNRDFESELLMKPGEMVAFSTKTNEKVETRVVEPKVLTSWKDGVLEFTDVPVSKIMDRIQEIYGWKSVYQKEELRARKISTPLPSNDLESALIILRKAIGIEIEKIEEENTLLLY